MLFLLPLSLGLGFPQQRGKLSTWSFSTLIFGNYFSGSSQGSFMGRRNRTGCDPAGSRIPGVAAPPWAEPAPRGSRGGGCCSQAFCPRCRVLFPCAASLQCPDQQQREAAIQGTPEPARSAPLPVNAGKSHRQPWIPASTPWFARFGLFSSRNLQ